MNRICKLFNIEYPVIQGGMVWCSGWRLAAAVSNCGGLGLIGAGSMYPDTLEHHIRKAKEATGKTFGVNVPLLYPDVEQVMDIIWKLKVPVVFTSAGSPKKWTGWLKERGIIVVHVVSSVAFALKSEEAGVDAIVAEGFEAGGHNGREETTTMTLIPAVSNATGLPLLAAGGIASGKAMLAAMILGAEGIQMGSRFAVSEESSAHSRFKNLIIQTGEGGTQLSLKKIAPVRMVKNPFFELVDKAEKQGAPIDELLSILGRGRAKKGIFEGDLENGELEIGQVSALINEVLPVDAIMKNLIKEYFSAIDSLSQESRFGF